MTIHKVQGTSLDKAVIDLGKDIFDHGKAYVALSRVRKLEDVLLVGLLRASFDKNKSCVLMSMHAWLDVLFRDNNILAGRQRLYLILLCVPTLMCLYNHYA